MRCMGKEASKPPTKRYVCFDCVIESKAETKRLESFGVISQGIKIEFREVFRFD